MTTTIGTNMPCGTPVLLIGHFTVRIHRIGLSITPGGNPFAFWCVITAAGPDTAPDAHSRHHLFSLN